MQRRNLISLLVSLALGAIGTVQYHRAQFSSRFDIFFGDRGDARGLVYFCEHWYQAFRGKTNLLSPGIFYPIRGTLAYSDLLLGYAVPYSLLRALGVSMFSAVEVLVIGLGFLSYLACFFLLNRVLRFTLAPSCAGAMFFAFSSPRFFQLEHLQLQYVVFLPLIFICIISFAQKSENLSQKKATVLLSLAGLFLNLQLLTAFYYAWFFVFWSFLFLLLAVVFPASRVFIFTLVKKYRPAIFASAAIFLVGLVPFLLLYLPMIHVGTWYSYANVSSMIPEWWSLLSMGDGNYVWGWLSAAVRPNPPPESWGELMIGIGLIPSLTWLLLTLSALSFLKKSFRARTTNQQVGIQVEPGAEARVFLAVMILATTLFYMFGVKYWGGHSLWYFVYGFFPGARAIRAMSRYVIFLSLPMAIAFAYILHSGLQWISKQKSLRLKTALAIGITLFAGFGVFEQFGVFTVGGTGFSKRDEMSYLKAMAAKLPVDCKAFYLAPGPRANHSPAEYQYDAMLISILRGIPTLNGSSSQFPANWSLYFVKDREYEANIKKWIDLNHLDDNVCRLEIGPQVEEFSPHMPNPIFDPSFFVSQQYRDFFDREPVGDEARGLAERVRSCAPNDVSCSRAAISLGLFYSTGFSDKGSFVFRSYEAGLGRMPRFEEFKSGMRQLLLNTDPKLSEKVKNGFIEKLVQTPEFVARYGGMSDSQYLDLLLKTAQISSSAQVRRALAGQNTREQVLRKIAESGEVSSKLKTRAFVALQYFGYLKRDPEEGGFNRWLDELNKTGDFAHVTSGFVDSSEYRERFGSSILP
jgi:hypothetical protein